MNIIRKYDVWSPFTLAYSTKTYSQVKGKVGVGHKIVMYLKS